MADFESTRTWTWSEYLSSIFQSVYPWLAIHCLLRSPETVPLVSKHYFSSFTRNLLKSFSVFLRLDCFRTARLISTHHGMAFSLVSEQHLSEHLLESPLGWNSWKLTKKKKNKKNMNQVSSSPIGRFSGKRRSVRRILASTSST